MPHMDVAWWCMDRDHLGENDMNIDIVGQNEKCHTIFSSEISIQLTSKLDGIVDISKRVFGYIPK